MAGSHLPQYHFPEPPIIKGRGLYFLTDALGSVHYICRGSDGAVLQSYDYTENGVFTPLGRRATRGRNRDPPWPFSLGGFGPSKAPSIALGRQNKASSECKSTSIKGVLQEIWGKTIDPDGNMISRVRDDTGVTVTYQWNDLNKLVADSGGPTTDAKQDSLYGVDGFRRRKKGKDDVVTTEYADGLATAVAKSSSSTVNYFKAHQLVGFEKDGDFFYFLTDALGTVRDVVDSTGAVKASYEFDPDGNKISPPNSMGVESQKTWIGGLSVQDETADTDLYLMGHRWYSASAGGRFLSRDPIGFAGGLNLYSYAGNSPVSKVDPLGLRDEWAGLSIKARAQATLDYVIDNHMAEISYAHQRTGIPKAAIAALLAMERRNDALVYGRRDRWKNKYPGEELLGDARGPANMSQASLNELIQAGKAPAGASIDPCSGKENVKFGALFMGYRRSWLERNDPGASNVPEDVMGYTLSLDDRLWIKAISFYNEFEGDDYTFGKYGRELVVVYGLARKELPQSWSP